MRLRLTFLILLFSFVPVANGADELRAVMFAAADQARSSAQQANAEEFSPRNYARGVDAYSDAERDLGLNRNLDKIRNSLAEAVVHFGNATKVANKAQTELAALIKTRKDAASVDAGLHDRDNWRQAEQRYAEAIVENERGDYKLSQRRATEAEALFRKAELTAIKAAYLNEAKRLLAQADRAKADKYAPHTFAKAQELLSKAETELSRDRYDTDRPRDLARQAQYEARHALYLAGLVAQARKNDIEIEDFVLAGEVPLSQVAAAADLNVGFDQGYAEAAARIIAHIESLQTANRNLEQDLYERVSQVETLQSQLAALEKQFGGLSQQRVELSEQLERQRLEREKFRRLETMFVDDQVTVLRSGNDIILRLVGTSFAVGKSTIDPEAFGLLTRVMDAFRLYPDALIRIEGHTDSHGGDAFNMELSQKRADAVKAYLAANMELPDSRLSAQGFGETRPVANNETAPGRAKNRRIDVVIYTGGQKSASGAT